MMQAEFEEFNMRKIFAAALCAGLACSSSAFAERWVAPVNGTVSAVAMPDGDVMMQIQIPAKEYVMINRDMRANNDHCIIKETGAANTMVLVCGADIK
jgi:hypothetical protein